MLNKDSTLPFISLLPNFITLIGMTIGLTSIRYALDSKWEYAVGLIVISAFIDGLDGRVARALNASSKFGAELDSLSDFLNFGVAPAILLYLWCFIEIPFKGVGWSITALIIICCAVRLARFNSGENHENIFKGVSAPCGGGLLLVPIMLSFSDFNIIIDKYYIGFYSLIIAFLMVSNIATISVKNIHIPHKFYIPLLIFFAFIFALLVIRPWIFLPFMGLIYISSIPFTVFSYRNK
jgi:CDP-diacylglycerol--serine O-phosphatidyltransferase